MRSSFKNYFVVFFVLLSFIFTLYVFNQSYNNSLAQETRYQQNLSLSLLKESFIREESFLIHQLLEVYRNASNTHSFDQGPFLEFFIWNESDTKKQGHIFVKTKEAQARQLPYIQLINKKSEKRNHWDQIQGADGVSYLTLMFSFYQDSQLVKAIGLLPLNYWQKILPTEKSVSQFVIFNENRLALLHSEIDFVGTFLNHNEILSDVLDSGLQNYISEAEHVLGRESFSAKELLASNVWVLVKQTYTPLVVAKSFLFFVPWLFLLCCGVYYMMKDRGLELPFREDSSLKVQAELNAPAKTQSSSMSSQDPSPPVADPITKPLERPPSKIVEPVVRSKDRTPLIEGGAISHLAINENDDFMGQSFLKESVVMDEKINTQESSMVEEWPVFSDAELESFLKGVGTELKYAPTESDRPHDVRDPKLADGSV